MPDDFTHAQWVKLFLQELYFSLAVEVKITARNEISLGQIIKFDTKLFVKTIWYIHFRQSSQVALTT
jgi:hypothetical protein